MVTKSIQLQVHHEGQLVGDIDYHLDSQKFSLIYSSEWLRKGFPLSPHLPLFESIDSDNISKFLENLLPEGDALKTLTRTLQTTSGNIIGLIKGIGKDATGAFSFSIGDLELKTSFRHLPVEELTERVLKRAEIPISIWDGKPRLSLAGVQEKLGVTLKDGEYGFGEGDLASTHILKFSSKGQNLVLNEFFCMSLAKRIGLNVANVELVRFGERALQVERFDRKWVGHDKVSRIHIIDACQALNAPPAFKYQRIVPDGPHKDDYYGPVTVKNLSLFCQECQVPANARLNLLHWVIFNLLIGNTDNHGKNISYFVGHKGIGIAPAYDLLNVTMYKDFNHDLSFKIGDTFDLNEVQAYQLLEMARDMDLAPRLVTTHLQKICESILLEIESVSMETDLDSEEEQFLKELIENIRKRVDFFLAQSRLIMPLAKSQG